MPNAITPATNPVSDNLVRSRMECVCQYQGLVDGVLYNGDANAKVATVIIILPINN